MPIVLMLMLVIPAVMLVSLPTSGRSSEVDGTGALAPQQLAPLDIRPAEPARSGETSGLNAVMGGLDGDGAYLAGNVVPVANVLTIEQAEAAGVIDIADADASIAPPSDDDCKGCPDRPRRTRTPRPNNNDPTPTAVAQPTDTPLVLPTETPVVLPTETAVPSPTSPPPATWTPVPVTTTPVPNYHNPPPAVVAAEAQMYQLINAHRASIGRNQWARVSSLDLAQRDWAVQMVTTNQCYHGDYGGRAAQQGYTGFAWGEVGACGYPTVQEAFQGWLDSPGHRFIIEAGTDMDDVGIGAWQYPNGYFQFWALVGDSH
jgi:uncharacterized protein YkwD